VRGQNKGFLDGIGNILPVPGFISILTQTQGIVFRAMKRRAHIASGAAAK